MEMTTDMLAPEDVLAPARPAPDALLPALPTLSPEKYAAAVYKPFKERLAAAIDSVKAIDYDITTTAGMGVAVKARALFRDLRVEADKERKVRKEPITKIGKLLESGFDEVEARVTPLEELFDADIQAEAARKLEVKLANEKRIAGIKALIDAIRMRPANAVGKTSLELRVLLESAAAETATVEVFAEFIDDAQSAMDIAGRELVAMYGAAQEREAAAAKAEADRQAELKAIADQKAEQARIAAAQAAKEKDLADAEAALQRKRDEDAAAAKAAADKVAAANAAAAKVIADAAADLAAKQAAFQKQQDDAAAAAAKAEQDRAIQQAARMLIDDDHAEALPMNAQFDADREAERVRLQALADEALAAGRERQSDEHAAGLPAGALGVDSMADLAIIDEANDEEIITMVATAFDLSILEAVERLSRIDFDAARTLAEAA